MMKFYDQIFIKLESKQFLLLMKRRLSDLRLEDRKVRMMMARLSAAAVGFPRRPGSWPF